MDDLSGALSGPAGADVADAADVTDAGGWSGFDGGTADLGAETAAFADFPEGAVFPGEMDFAMEAADLPEATGLEANFADFPETADAETADFPEAADLARSEAEKAADYARSLGFDRAGDYIERHYDGDVFVPGDPIPITTRNMALEGTESGNGVPFERRTAELAEGLSVEGVFPDFESRHHVELGDAANDMSLHQQFSACREDFQDHMYDCPEKLQGLTVGEMERMALPQGYAPEGYTWQHNPETGSFDLVSRDDHAVGHTGGNALWGRHD